MNEKKMIATMAMQAMISSGNVNYHAHMTDRILMKKIARGAFDLAEAMEIEYDSRYSDKTLKP